MSEGLKGAHLLIKYYNSLRTEQKFQSFYESVLESSKDLTDEPVLPRQRKTPSRYQEGTQTHRYSSPKDRYRHAFYEALEHAIGEIQRRFDQPDLHVVSEVEALILNAANGEEISDIPEAVCDYFKEKINLSDLKIQLCMLPNAIQTVQGTKIKRVTTIRTVAETLNTSTMVNGMLKEVGKLVQAYYTFPVTSATAERSFSCLRRIKTFLRSTMTHQRLNNLFLLYVHTSRTDSLDLSAVAREFVLANT